MEKAKAEFYKLFFDELQRKKTRNSPDAKAFEEKLFGLIGSELDYSSELKKVQDHVNRIAFRFDVMDKESEKRAQHFYKDFPRTTSELKDLKSELISYYQLFEMNFKNENHKQAARYAIIQLEGILNFIQSHLIEWIKSDPQRENQHGSKIKSHYNGSQSIEFINKCWLAKDFFNMKFIPYKEIKHVYAIRNYESHLITSHQKDEFDENLADLRAEPIRYFNSVFEFERSCFIAMKTLFPGDPIIILKKT